jgi:hypothetical protein
MQECETSLQEVWDQQKQVLLLEEAVGCIV